MSTSSISATYYGVYRDNVEVSTTTQTSFTDTGLEEYQPLPGGNGQQEAVPYVYYVVAYNSAGASSESLPITASAYPAPGPVTGFSISVSGNTVSFSTGESAPLNGLNGTNLTYIFYRSLSPDCSVSSVSVGSWFPKDDYPMLSDKNLSPGTYYYCADALDQGTSPYYGPVTAPIEATITTVGNTPSLIGNIEETNNTLSSITLTWSPSVDASGILGYEIFGSSTYVNGLLQPAEIGVVATTTYTGSVLPSYIVPYDANTENMPLYQIIDGYLSVLPWASQITGSAFSNPETVVPVSNLYAITVGDSAEMNWYESTDEQYQSLTWNLYRTTTSGCAATPADLVMTGVPNDVGHVLDGYADVNVPLGTYYYCVAPVNAVGVVGLVSPQLQVTITSSTWGGPTPPGDFTITNVGSSKMSLSWTASANPLTETYADPGNEILYQVYRDGTQIATTSATSFTDTSYTTGSNYAVVAYNPSSLLATAPYHQSSIAAGVDGTLVNVLGGNTPIQFINYIANALGQAGYQITETTDALGEISGMASENGKVAIYFGLADQAVTGAPANNGGQCSVQAPGTTGSAAGIAIPVLVSPDGTIPHISTDFNIIVDPSMTNPNNINWGSTTPEAAQDEIINVVINGLSPYYQADTAGVLPVPTDNSDAGALVVLSAGNIPDGQNNTIVNGVSVSEQDEFAAQTVYLSTTIAQSGYSGYSQYVPAGTASAIVNALNAGKSVVVDMFNTQFWPTGAALTSLNAAGTDEHELGHGIFGLGDDYGNTNSPMQGGGNNGPIPIAQNIYNTIKAIQQKQALPLSSVGCVGTGAPLATSPWYPPSGTAPVVFMDNTWSIVGQCTADELDSGWINDPTALGGCRMPNATTSATIVDNYTPTNDGTTPGYCTDNYGNNYTCAPVNCGQSGQYSCPVTVPQGTCLDANGSPYKCTSAPETYASITPPPPPTDECNPDDPVASPECPSATNQTCTPNAQGVMQCTYPDGSDCSCGSDGTVSCVNPDGSSLAMPTGACQGTCGAGLIQGADGSCIVDCNLYPNNPVCPDAPANIEEDYCNQTPDDPTCATSTSCASDPSGTACQDYCSLNAQDPVCSGASNSTDACDIDPTPDCSDYCDFYPQDPSCGGDDSTSAVSVPGSSLAANSRSSSAESVDQTAIISRSLEGLFDELGTLLKSL